MAGERTDVVRVVHAAQEAVHVLRPTVDQQLTRVVLHPPAGTAFLHVHDSIHSYNVNGLRRVLRDAILVSR